MDIVLEIFDTFIADRLYAAAIPASLGSAAYQSVKNVADATFSSLREGATPAAAAGGYQFQPASQIYTLQPSRWAYMSAWPRDYAPRQALSLYLITWYGILPRHASLQFLY